MLIVFILSLHCIILVSGIDYRVFVSHNGPVILGANITFKAELWNNYGERPRGKFIFMWEDNAIPSHSGETEGTETSSTWIISYPQKQYSPGEYEVQVSVQKDEFFSIKIASERMKYNITRLLNGKMDLIQNNTSRDKKLVLNNEEVLHEIALTGPDFDYIEQNAFTVYTYWFVDCLYLGETSDYKFRYNYTDVDIEHNIQAVVIASFDPPPTSTSTSTSTTTTTTTTTTTPSNHTSDPHSTTPATTTLSPHSTTKSLVTRETSESNEIDKMYSFSGFNGNVLSDNNTIHLPESCAKNFPLEPHKAYGSFKREAIAKSPISNVMITGLTWLPQGDGLDLNISCNGSKSFVYCFKKFRGLYNVTGKEYCDSTIQTDVCNFTLYRYLQISSVYTILIIIENSVSKVISPVAIHVYEVSKQAQLSVIVVPVSCSLIAVILIVFGVAYYIQSKNRYTIEVADFDFGQVNGGMEYKTFRERLRDAMTSAINRTGDFIEQDDVWSSPSRKYGSMQ